MVAQEHPTAQLRPRCTRCGATSGLVATYLISGDVAHVSDWRCRDEDACRERQSKVSKIQKAVEAARKARWQ